MKPVFSPTRTKAGAFAAIVLLAASGVSFLAPSRALAIDASPPKRDCVWDPQGGRWRCAKAFEIPGTKRECIWDVNGTWEITSRLGEYYIHPPQAGVPITLQVSLKKWSEWEGKPYALIQGMARNQAGETGQATIHWTIKGGATHAPYLKGKEDLDYVKIDIAWDRPRKFCCAYTGPVDGWVDKFEGTISRAGELIGHYGWVSLMGDKPYTDQMRAVLEWRRKGKFRCITTPSIDDVVARPPDDFAPPPGPPQITQPQLPPPPNAPGTQPYGAIGDKYAKLGGPGSGIGPTLGGEVGAPHGGRCQAFQHGSICWHPEIGEAFTVWGDIHKKWVQHKGVEYGYPITDELTTPDGRGRYNHFRKMQDPSRPETSIYWTPTTGAHAIYGAIREAWAQQGWERGPLGYPTSDEHQDGKYRRVNFERGAIRWAPDTGIEITR